MIFKLCETYWVDQSPSFGSRVLTFGSRVLTLARKRQAVCHHFVALIDGCD